MSERIAQLAQAPDPKLVKSLQTLIRRIRALQEERGNCMPLIAEFNAISGQNHNAEYFYYLPSWTSDNQAAKASAMGVPPAITDLTRDELIESLRIILSAKEPSSTFFIELLERNYPEAFISDLVNSPHRRLTAEEIVDELLLRRQLYRCGGSNALYARLAELAQEVLADPAAPTWAVQWALRIPDTS